MLLLTTNLPSAVIQGEMRVASFGSTLRALYASARGVFIDSYFRKNRPDAERPYKAFGYPVLPAIYIIMAIVFCVMLIIYKPAFTWPGLIIVLAGIPIYYIAVANKNKAS